MRGVGGAAALLVLLAPTAGAQTPAPLVPLTPGMVITHSVVIQPGRYYLPAPAGPIDSMGFASPAAGVIRIEGDNITVDFAGAELVGSPPDASPDQFAGIGVEIAGGHDVTVRNARIRGYKIAILAHDTRRLTLDHNDVSHNWKPRLYSGWTHESLVDWLYFHHDENGEWRRYGAGIFLDRVSGGEIQGNTATEGMNGLLMARTGEVRVWNNTFSYLSGVGIGLYRSSRNTIMYNRVDYCVRGASFGHYARGQDSAALLMFEQSSDNTVAYNSMTHGGDGLFLWAGQYTMDTGTGGSNDNLFYRNDFSEAVTNGMEATFSRNRFVANRVENSWHGLWGGYSWSSLVLANSFAGNREAIAIEHGQSNRITDNTFDGDTTAVHLWWSKLEPSDWGYPRKRDTRSHDYEISGNIFRANRVGVVAQGSQDVAVFGNRFAGVDTLIQLSGDTAGWEFSDNELVPNPGPLPARTLSPGVLRYAPDPIPGGMDAMIPAGGRRGRSTIIVDQWGPYDWRYPKLWPAGNPDSTVVPLQVLGPPGHWRVADTAGIAALSRSSGTIPDTITITRTPGAALTALRLEYVGESVETPEGSVIPRAAPYRFDWWRFDPPALWQVRFIAWDSTSDPRSDSAAFWRRLDTASALVARTEPRLDYMWYRPTITGVPATRYAVEARQTVDLPPGRYHLRTISDDGIRVWVDGRLAIDHWIAHESKVDSAPIPAGHHTIRAAYYQVDGWTELRVEVVPDQGPWGGDGR